MCPLRLPVPRCSRAPSGRVRAGPAPRNLEVPPYKFLPGEDDVILVGEND